MDLTKFLTEQVAASGRMWRSSFRVALMLACVIVMAAGFLPAEQNASAAVAYHSRLAAQKSPYLLAHAHDLVDWHPWGPEAFAEARSKNKLIFLSVGYSSCHWCHVMQREDFENPQVAQLINRYFISILVDREERPEVDNQYLAVCEMLTGSGGWPLNVIMTPDRKPFFASTYIPRESERGRTGMLELIPEIEQKWKRNPAQLMNGGEKLAKLLEHNLDVNAPGQALGAAALKSASNQLASSFDSRNGGFGGAPKFPPALDILFLLRAWKRDGDANALKMAEKTLDAMRGGGIFDQVGFGFHRYATDAEWRTPHFEKMLYDQALLAIAY
ncbi:MAG: thioredoxin domain-containing protein, partial [Candidatus Acidiferrales bacterium]